MDSTNLHAQNAHLIGLGLHIPAVLFDIDSITRQFLPSIGANEICISPDSVNLYCGDSLSLVKCNFINNPNVVWSPSIGLNDPGLSTPKASPAVSTWYYGKDTITGITDSIRINILPFQVHTNNDTLLKCGDSLWLDATYNAGATYRWSPSLGLNDSTKRRPWAKPLQTTTYIVIANSICGTTSDTITINVNPLPQAQYALSSIVGLYVAFYNQSTCADTYLWNFGDGDTSSLFNPNHLYGTSGIYLVTLIACNTYGCDTIVYNVSVDNTGINEVSSVANFVISPNPSNGAFDISFESPSQNISIYITDILGRNIHSEELGKFVGSYKKTIDLSSFNKGIYFVRIVGEKGSTTKKIILN